jgi:hypothetical protein
MPTRQRSAIRPRPEATRRRGTTKRRRRGSGQTPPDHCSARWHVGQDAASGPTSPRRLGICPGATPQPRPRFADHDQAVGEPFQRFGVRRLVPKRLPRWAQSQSLRRKRRNKPAEATTIRTVEAPPPRRGPNPGRERSCRSSR